MMFFAHYGLGLEALTKMVGSFPGSRLYLNVDALRNPDGAVPGWIA